MLQIKYNFKHKQKKDYFYRKDLEMRQKDFPGSN